MQGANGGIPLRVGLLFVVVADWVREGREGGGGRYVSSLDGACEGTKAYDGHAEFAVWTDEFCFWEGERERERGSDWLAAG